MKIAIAGAGFSGATIAHELAVASEGDYEIDVFDQRPWVGGNCHTTFEAETGAMMHTYGPHIFHTENERVWEYVNRFAPMMPYRHRTRAVAHGKVYSFPVNLLTINQFYERNFSPTQAELWMQRQCKLIAEPKNFEEKALTMVGQDLYEAFFKGYTEKQWGRNASEIPASVFSRLPVRFNYNDEYFPHPHQAIPRNGYTDLIRTMLRHDAITVFLETPFRRKDCGGYDHVFWTGCIDEFYDFAFGRLPYRTLDFEQTRHSIFDAQGASVINYCDRDVPFTRIAEHKHFSPWIETKGTVLVKEFSREFEEGDIPYYPIKLVGTQAALDAYQEQAKKEERVTFVGRLGTFRYMDMDATIAQALAIADEWLRE